jgi:hypothetical protein
MVCSGGSQLFKKRTGNESPGTIYNGQTQQLILTQSFPNPITIFLCAVMASRCECRRCLGMYSHLTIKKPAEARTFTNHPLNEGAFSFYIEIIPVPLP